MVHVVEEVDRVREGAARLDSFVGTGFGAEAAVHTDAEVDLVADLVQTAVSPRLRGDEDAAVGAGLGAGAAARAAFVEPEEAGAGAGRDVTHFFRELDGKGRLEDVPEGDPETLGET